MKRRLIAVGTTDPNPESWQYIEVYLFIARSKREACRMKYPYLAKLGPNELARYARENSCLVDMSKTKYVATKEHPFED